MEHAFRLILLQLVSDLDYVSANAAARTCIAAARAWRRIVRHEVSDQHAALRRGLALRYAARTLVGYQPFLGILLSRGTERPYVSLETVIRMPPRPSTYASDAACIGTSIAYGFWLNTNELDVLRMLSIVPASWTPPGVLRNAYNVPHYMVCTLRAYQSQLESRGLTAADILRATGGETVDWLPLNITPFTRPFDGLSWHDDAETAWIMAIADSDDDDDIAAAADVMMPTYLRRAAVRLERSFDGNDNLLARPDQLRRLDDMCAASAALIHGFLYISPKAGLRIPGAVVCQAAYTGDRNLMLTRLHLTRGRRQHAGPELWAYECATRFKAGLVPHADDRVRIGWHETRLADDVGEQFWNIAGPCVPLDSVVLVRPCQSMRQQHAVADAVFRTMQCPPANVVHCVPATAVLPELRIIGRVTNVETRTTTIEIFTAAETLLAVFHRVRTYGNLEMAVYSVSWTTAALALAVDGNAWRHGTLRCRILRGLDNGSLIKSMVRPKRKRNAVQ